MKLEVSSPVRRGGFTVIELLIATAVGVIILGASISLIISNRRVYELDRLRTELNQNLRGALDLLGTDIRLAGQGLPADFPALSIGGGGTVLTVRTSRISTVLSVCQTVAANASSILVAEDGNSTPGCARVPISLTDTRHSPMAQFEAERTRGGATTEVAYIYDPATLCNDTTRVRGEFFTYSGASNPASGPVILQKTGSDLSRPYPVGSRIYLLEQRVYSLEQDGNELQLSVNGGAAQGVATHISGVSFQAFVSGSTTPVTSFCNALGQTLLWKTLGRVSVRINGAIPARGTSLRRSLEADFLPRNVLSR
ncbi:MAG: hypothetical protein SFU83_10405 [Meiothermus sp.]|nr:hypothetical protein [Meiothermus sp.]